MFKMLCYLSPPLALCSCALFQKPETKIVIQYPDIPPNLLTKCDNLSKLEGTTGKAIMPWIIQTSAQYKECQAKHNALIKVVSKPE